MTDEDQERGERLRKARAMAGYKTGSDAARAMHVGIPTYLGHENGSRGFDAKAALKYCKHFKIDVEWLLYGVGNPRGPSILDKIKSLSPARRAEVERFIEYQLQQETASRRE